MPQTATAHNTAYRHRPVEPDAQRCGLCDITRADRLIWANGCCGECSVILQRYGDG
jgi:hypothetical protein